MKVNLYVIQQGPIHNIPSTFAINIYKNLFARGELTGENLRNLSCSRKEYTKQQARFEQFFATFKEIRGLTFIYVDDVVCDEEVCPLDTGERPYFADNYHLSLFGAARLKARFQKYLSY